jgi:hypothetical protein
VPVADRHDARAAVVGVAVLLAGGLGFGVALGGGLPAWLGSVGIAAGVMNVTSAILRRRSGDGPQQRQPLEGAELRRRLTISFSVVAVTVACAVIFGLTLGKSGILPSVLVAVVLGSAMVFFIVRRPPA